MNSLWDDGEAVRHPGELGIRVYTSRLLGRDKSLVLHGGGNTSVKVIEQNLVGELEPVLYVKGSGWDLATIEEKGVSPVRITPLLQLVRLKTVTDAQMENELIANMTRAGAPNPSVETILHALLPYISSVSVFEHIEPAVRLGIIKAIDGTFSGQRLVFAFEYHPKICFFEHQLTAKTAAELFGALTVFFWTSLKRRLCYARTPLIPLVLCISGGASHSRAIMFRSGNRLL
jgi:hypothetical protein